MTLPDLNLASINKRLDDTLEALAKSDAELKWELAGSAVDIAGLVDPTPTSDLIGAGLALRSGDFIGAALSTVSMVPYVGDAMAKPVKAVRTGKKIVALEQKVAKLTKEANDLKKLKKEAEAADAAAAAVKEGKASKQADKLKETSAQQKDGATTKGKDCEDCGASKPLSSSAPLDAPDKTRLAQVGGLKATEGKKVTKANGKLSNPTHPLEKHGPDVTDQYLHDRVAKELSAKNYTGLRTAFNDRAQMETAISETFEQKRKDIDAWISSGPTAGVPKAFEANPGMGNLGRGFEVKIPGGPITPISQPMPNINLVLIPDGLGGYLIHTAHPF